MDSYVADAINANPFFDIVDMCRFVVLKKFIDIIKVINLCEVNFHIYERSKRNSRIDTQKIHICDTKKKLNKKTFMYVIHIENFNTYRSHINPLNIMTKTNEI